MHIYAYMRVMVRLHSARTPSQRNLHQLLQQAKETEKHTSATSALFQQMGALRTHRKRPFTVVQLVQI